MSTALRWLRVHHDTHYDYDAPVELAHHVACLRPRSTPLQQIRAWSVAIDPVPDEWGDDPHQVPERQWSQDPWGNVRLSFSHSTVHSRLSVRSHFEAGVAPPPELDPQDSPAWEQVAESLLYHAGATSGEAVEFALATPLAPHDAALAAYARGAFEPGRALAASALALMQCVHQDFEYAPLSTHAATRATDALAQRKGVCQDFAHVMIGACRSLGLAARYVSGYLLTQPPPGQARLIGADASHAWVEVWCPRQGWLALDPTNGMAAGQDHVTLAWGRDYTDVAPLRGVIRGGGRVQPRVEVTVEPLDERPAAIRQVGAA